MDSLLSPKEAAAFLRVSPDTLAVWRCTKRYPNLPYVKIGGRIRYERADLIRWVKSYKRTYSLTETLQSL